MDEGGEKEWDEGCVVGWSEIGLSLNLDTSPILRPKPNLNPNPNPNLRGCVARCGLQLGQPPRL